MVLKCGYGKKIIYVRQFVPFAIYLEFLFFFLVKIIIWI